MIGVALSLPLSPQVVENMRAIDVIPKLTPHIMDRIENVMKNRPKLPDSLR